MAITAADRSTTGISHRSSARIGGGPVNDRNLGGGQDRAWPTVQGRRTKTSDWIEEVEAPETKLQ